MFASPERRSMLLPLILAVAALAVVAALLPHFLAGTTVNAQWIGTQILPTTTVYKSQSIVVGQNEVAETLFIASTLRIENRTREPVFVDGVSLTLTGPTGAELTEKALSKQDILTSEQSFPKVKQLLRAGLLEDEAVAPGASVQGTSLFSLSVPKTLWDQRRSAIVKIDLYHQQSVFVTLPRS